MNKDEFNMITEVGDAATAIHIDDIPVVGDRTMLYGYDCERNTFHVYLLDGEIHAVTYTYDKRCVKHLHGSELPADALVPDKRAYPERTDAEFTRMLIARGVTPPFTTFGNQPPGDVAFHGLLHTQLH